MTPMPITPNVPVATNPALPPPDEPERPYTTPGEDNKPDQDLPAGGGSRPARPDQGLPKPPSPAPKPPSGPTPTPSGPTPTPTPH
jgi:hypothetical protein